MIRIPRIGLLSAILLVGAGLALIALSLPLPGRWLRHESDAAVYWEAAQCLRAGGDCVYQPFDPGEYIYPPAFAAFFALLTLLPRAVAYGLWAIAGLCFVAWALCAELRLLAGNRCFRCRDVLVALAIGIGVPIATSLREGQSSVLLLALLAAGLAAILIDKRDLRGGALLGLAAQIKVLPLALVPMLALQRRWRACGGFVLGMTAASLMPAVWLVPARGWPEGLRADLDLHRYFVSAVAWPRVSAQDAYGIGGARVPNNAFVAVTRRLFETNAELSFVWDERGPLLVAIDPRMARWIGPALGLALYAAALALAQRRRDSLGTTAAAGLALIAADLGSLLSWPHHLVLLALVVGPLSVQAVADSKANTHLRLALATLVIFTYAPSLDASELFQAWGLPSIGTVAAWSLAFAAFWHPCFRESDSSKT